MPRGQYDRSKTAINPEPAASEPPVIPSRVKLIEAHGFVNEYGAVYFKPGGAIITNPIEIGMLIKRGAPLEEV